jgi:hypothetical protein
MSRTRGRRRYERGHEGRATTEGEHATRGRASVRIVDGVTEEYLASARKTMDAEAAAQFEQSCRELYDQMARVAITPHWVRCYDFGAGRLPRFLQELVERTGG